MKTPTEGRNPQYPEVRISDVLDSLCVALSGSYGNELETICLLPQPPKETKRRGRKLGSKNKPK